MFLSDRCEDPALGFVFGAFLQFYDEPFDDATCGPANLKA